MEDSKVYLCQARMPARFNKTRVKKIIHAMDRTFYEISPDELDPKIKYKSFNMTNPETGERITLYY